MNARKLSFAISVGVLSLGCTADFDPPHELKTLRVLAVQKSAPYAKPGETVDLSMLWYDGSKKAPRPVQVGWFAGCFNPLGDLYAGCFADLAKGGPTGPGGLPPGIQFGTGDTFSFDMPSDVISSRPPPVDPKQPAYGLAVVFFAACAGKLGPPPEGEAAGFPVACYGPGDERLGADDFVAGYSTIYSFENYRNQNAIITGFQVAGVDASANCVDAACLGAPPPATLDCNTAPCVQACADDGDKECPEISVKPLIDPASAELDQVSADAYGKKYEEQMWIRYYVSRGGVKSDVRLLNDAQKGWSSDHGTKLFAPKKPGPMSLWAVVHDNRGGSAWVRQDILVQ
ncbi:MAG: hypothetical protein IPI67_09295 [Myxococcales bacterium]|nr:hypothetical protein [Myxococcales bacterium]